MFKNMKLALKIGGGFVIVLILTALVGFIGWNSINGAHRRVGITEYVYEIEINILEIRQYEKNFIMRGSHEYIENVIHLVKGIREHTEELKTLVKDSADSKRIEDTLTATDNYEKAFNQFVDLREERTLADGKMLAGARAVQAQADVILKEQKAEYLKLRETNAADSLLDDKLTKRANANQIIKWILECRRHEKNYQLRHDTEYKDKVDKIVADAISLAKDLRSRFNQAYNQEQADKIIAQTQVYLTAFDDYIEVDLNMDKAEEEMVEAAREVQRIVDETLTGQKLKLEREIARATLMILSGATISVIFGLIMTVLITLSITKVMKKGVIFAEAIAQGRLDVDLNVNQKDEIGQLMDSLRKMLESFRYKAGEVKFIADGNLTRNIKKASNDDGLGQSLIDMSNSLNNTLGQVNMSVDQINIDADKGNKQMEVLSEAMAKINTSSDEIKKVVKVIDDLAFQTNLLALNANVEAARAGKYGKGFAVVADEVRNLAVRSAAAVKETTGNVDDSIRNIEAGSKAVEATATQLVAIMGGSSRVADFLEEIATASKEQAEAIDQITQGLEQIDQVTQSNTASAEESAAAAEELASQSVQLKSMVAAFKLNDTQAAPAAQQRQLEYQPKVKAGVHSSTQQVETGTKPVNPAAVISLDDDDFDRF